MAAAGKRGLESDVWRQRNGCGRREGMGDSSMEVYIAKIHLVFYLVLGVYKIWVCLILLYVLVIT